MFEAMEAQQVGTAVTANERAFVDSVHDESICRVERENFSIIEAFIGGELH